MAPAALTVTSTADTHQAGLVILREAVATANNDARTMGQSDTISFDPSLGTATITLTAGQLELSGVSSLATESIDGGGRITIDGGGNNRVVQIDMGVTAHLTGLTLTDGNASGSDFPGGYGGGIFDAGTLTLDNCTLTGNTANVSGGGVYSSGTLTVNNCTLASNTAVFGGGILNDQGMLVVTGGTFGNNSASPGDSSGNTGYGGGIDSLAGTVTANGTTFRSNSASFGGGISDGILNTVATIFTLTNCTFDSNSATTSAGGMYNTGTLTASGSNFTNNAASFGAAVYNDQGTVTVTGGSLTSNTVDGSGGAVYNRRGTLAISNATVSSNSANFGGGVYCFLGTSRFTGDTFDSNTVTSSGGSLFSNGTVTISNTRITNSAATFGGGVFNSGTMTLTTSTLDSDSASPNDTGAGGFGGGIYNYQSGQVLTVIGVTLTNNNAVSGGGIYNDHGRMTLNDSTLAGNSASTNNGGGVYNSGTMTVSNDTLSGNSASNNGGGIFNDDDASLTLSNSIVAGNSAENNPDYSGPVDHASSYNLLGDGDGLRGISSGSNGNEIGTNDNPIDPMLAPLDNYGGPTMTFALEPGSPAQGQGGPSTTLDNAIDTASTTLSVDSAASLAITPGLTIQIDSEQMTITGVNTSANTFTVARGVNGTTATDHEQGANLYPATDQRGSARVVGGSIDIGAYQTQSMAPPGGGFDSPRSPGGRANSAPMGWSAWSINDYLFSSSQARKHDFQAG